MSGLTGKGYGDKHEWKAGDTIQSPDPDERATYWRCTDCGAEFYHHYHVMKDIHEAIKAAGIPDACAGEQP